MVVKVIRILKSLRFTVFVTLCLIIVFIIGVIVPQERLLGRVEYLAWKTRNPELVSILESLHLTEIYVSPFVILLWILFFLNLLMVMASRIPVIWRMVHRETLPSEEALKDGYVIEGLSLEEFISKIRDKGYKVSQKGRLFFGVKNRYSPLLTPLFHLSFIFILAGALISYYTSFSAFADVAEGEVFQGDYSIIKKTLTGEIPFFMFKVISIKPEYYKGIMPTDLDIVIQDENGMKTIGINRPYVREDVSFVVKKIDVAPLFILQDADGRELDGAFVKMNVLQGGMDSFEMGGYRFRMSFSPDYGANTDRGDINLPQILKETLPEKKTRSFEIRNPAFEVYAFEGPKLINKKTIKMGEAIEFNGKRLLFADLVYWVRFYVVGERGLILIYGGFVLLIVSLSLRFIFPRKEIFGLEREGRIYTRGRVEFYGKSNIKKLLMLLSGILSSYAF